jgi:hypothetical protein
MEGRVCAAVNIDLETWNQFVELVECEAAAFNPDQGSLSLDQLSGHELDELTIRILNRWAVRSNPQGQREFGAVGSPHDIIWMTFRELVMKAVTEDCPLLSWESPLDHT